MEAYKKIAILPLVLTLMLVLNLYGTSFADNSLCARVKIEIEQELTLERQAFDAHMRITNGLNTISIENVKVEVKFTDKDGNPVTATSDPNDTSALFFIRVDTMEGINDVDGAGTVAPSSTADIHWLIIPAPGSAEENPKGTLYYVGATLSYTIGGEEHVTDVSPDYIYVKPMPELVLDYFLPNDVYGDDAFTPEIEPPVPFSLGVRVKNNGFGTAKNLRIKSAQPKIVENKNQLLIGFTITGSEVNGNPWTNSLLVDFGDIDSGKCGTARWTMECTLSGKFVEFTADFTHSDELGGEVTSLIDAVNTHFLIHDVLVDMAGRDDVKDFLAEDGDNMTVYESDGVDTPVTDQSTLSNLTHVSTTGTTEVYELSTPVTQGFMYVKLSDPTGGAKVVKRVIREDGKELDLSNAWMSKERNQDHTWSYYFNLFDFNTSGHYQVIFDEPEAGPPAPVLEFIPNRIVDVGKRISFVVHATNPDGTIPMMGADNLPDSAQFWDRGDGYGVFDWTPSQANIGPHRILFFASNGELRDSQNATITVGSGIDTDQDGLPDAMEFDNKCTYKTNPDSDGDGLKDGEEDANKNGIVDVNETDPCNPDTDGDGLSDGEEVLIYHTNPLNPDTDGDGVSDYEEVHPNGPPVIDTFTVQPDSGSSLLSVLFKCQVHDFDANDTVKGVTIHFGDDVSYTSYLPGDNTTLQIYHTYAEEGTYDVYCEANDQYDHHAFSDHKQITINNAVPRIDLGLPLFKEDFSNGIPEYWDVIDNGDGITWGTNDTCGRDPGSNGFSPPFPIVDYDCANGRLADDSLVSPPINLLADYEDTHLILTFANYFVDDYGTTFADVDISTDNGTSWTALLHTGHYTIGPGTVRLDLSPFLSDTSSVRLRYRFYNLASGSPYYWLIDDISIMREVNSIDFGTVSVGDESDSILLAVKNTGSDVLQVQSVSLEGEASGDFLVSQNTCPEGQSFWLDPGGSCSISVQFAPMAAGERVAYLEVLSNDPDNSTVSIRLVGTGASQTEPPQIDTFSASPDTGKAPLAVTLTCEAHDPDGTIVSYEWDFDGDGVVDETSDIGTIDHIYEISGIYNATCTVVDDDGASVTSGPVTIKVGFLPGDCNGDGKVSIDEIQKSINCFLGKQSGCCDKSDLNSDGTVSIDEVQKVVDAFLEK